MSAPRAEARVMRRRRRRMAIAIGLALVVFVAAFAAAGVALFAGTGSGDGPSSSKGAVAPTSTARAPVTTVAPATTTSLQPGPGTLSPIDVTRRYAVGTREATFVDTTRSTSPNGDFAGAPTRTIPVEYWYPADGAAGVASQADAPPDRAHGPYPLVMFAHGYAVTPDFYRPLLERWAAAGYVVAAPVYPILSGTPGGASHTDYEKTFDDTRFVIDQVTTLSPADPMAGLVDPKRIAAAGHSDGEVVAFGVGFLQCCRDPRVRSVVAMAGDLSNADNPHVRNLGIPILHIMETGDEFDPYQHSIDWDRENLDVPRWMLTLLGATHVPPYTQPGNAAFELVSAATIDFFDGTLKGHPERLDQMTSAVAAVPGVGALER